jgi:hypothetical protein
MFLNITSQAIRKNKLIASVKSLKVQKKCAFEEGVTVWGQW